MTPVEGTDLSVSPPVAGISSTPEPPRAVVVMGSPALSAHLFGPGLELLDGVVDLATRTILTDFTGVEATQALSGAEIIIGGWGCPVIGLDVLKKAPSLRAVVYAGGRGSDVVCPEVRAAGVRITNAGEANALPVAEYTLGMILLAHKYFFQAAREYRSNQVYINREATFPDAGNYRRRVGIIGASRIGRRVIDLLRPFDFEVSLFDPFVSTEQAAQMGVRKTSLQELMVSSDTVSLHAPHTAATDGMITGSLIRSMQPGATLINTARGQLIDQEALVEALRAHAINAILDVTDPDVLPPGHELYSLSNVLLTPHIAGSMSGELRRMGEHLVEELYRFRSGDIFLAEE